MATNGVLLFASLLLRKSKAMDGSSSGREIRQARPLIIRDGAACIRMDFLLAAPTRRPHGKTQPLAKAKKAVPATGQIVDKKANRLGNHRRLRDSVLLHKSASRSHLGTLVYSLGLRRLHSCMQPRKFANNSVRGRFHYRLIRTAGSSFFSRVRHEREGIFRQHEPMQYHIVV